MSKSVNTLIAAVAAVASLAGATAVPTIASAQARSNGVTSCDAPGGRQRAGAVIGGLVGAAAGSQVSRNERTLGAVVGGVAGAAAGSYIGCNQQRARANSQALAGASYRASSNLRVRSGPGTNYGQIGSVSAGQRVQVNGTSGDWARLNGGGWVSARYLSNY